MLYKWQKFKRLLKRSEYQHCYNFGEKHFTKLFVVFVRHAPEMRVGMAVSKKSGNAVARNRIKRILREFFRLNQALIPEVNLVVIPKRHLQAKRINYFSVEKDLQPLFSKIAKTKLAEKNQNFQSL